ncbi:MAG: helix-turn-helix domain-containing protein, partial [Chloroflexi bacterium]|nr:helix-turn-helix domain-containing protein [Chloroflexota bacterium]
MKGSQLKKIREEHAIPLEQVASETRIRLSILHDLEDDAYSELSSSTQTKGFLRLYAQYLGIDPDEPEPIIPAE